VPHPEDGNQGRYKLSWRPGLPSPYHEPRITRLQIYSVR
jgi:hypothetical protein